MKPRLLVLGLIFLSSYLVGLNDVRPGIKMPELEKSLVHEEGVELLGAWISSLPGSCNP